MKVVNEKGKLFGIINPVDLLIILAILAVVGAVGFKILAKPVSDAVAPKSNMIVTMRIRGAMPSLVDSTKQITQGTKLVSGNDYIDATVETVSVEPYLYTVANAQGVTVNSNDPVKKDIIITVKSSGSPDSAVLKIGNQEVRTGRGFIFKTNTVEINATIESVSFNG